MVDIERLTKTYDGRVFQGGYDPHHPGAKQYAERRLQEEIEVYKEHQRIAGMSVDEYLDELWRGSGAPRCFHCDSTNLVMRERRDPRPSVWRDGSLMRRVTDRLFGAWDAYRYMECLDCHYLALPPPMRYMEEEEQLIKGRLRQQAEWQHAYSVSQISKAVDEKLGTADG